MKIKPYNIDIEKAHIVLQAVSYGGIVSLQKLAIFINEKWEYELSNKQAEDFYIDAKKLISISDYYEYSRKYREGYSVN